MLSTIKLEYEMTVLRQMVFKNIADKLGGTVAEVEEIYKSTTRDALMSHLNLFRPQLNQLTDEEIKEHLGL